MAFSNTSSELVLRARLTKYGREQLLKNSSTTLVKFFALGDSDANYQTSTKLSSGEMPVLGGDITSRNCPMKDVFGNQNQFLQNKLRVGTTTEVYKSVNVSSSNIGLEVESVDINTGVTGTVITLDRTDYTSSSTNYFRTLRLPITTTEKTRYSTTTNSSGGFSDTAISGFNTDNVLLISVDDSEYSEIIDGKTLKVEAYTTGGTLVELYGTYSRAFAGSSNNNSYRDETTVAKSFGNVVYLFSDYINPPGGNTGNTWSTGYGIEKPFTLGGKKTYRYTTSGTDLKDVAVGIGHLDKGLIAITDETLVNEIDLASGVTVTFGSVNQILTQIVTCEAGRNQFYISTNSTWESGDKVRISEVGLYDQSKNLIAVAKPDRHIEKNINDLALFIIRLSL